MSEEKQMQEFYYERQRLQNEFDRKQMIALHKFLDKNIKNLTPLEIFSFTTRTLRLGHPSFDEDGFYYIKFRNMEGVEKDVYSAEKYLNRRISNNRVDIDDGFLTFE